MLLSKFIMSVFIFTVCLSNAMQQQGAQDQRRTDQTTYSYALQHAFRLTVLSTSTTIPSGNPRLQEDYYLVSNSLRRSGETIIFPGYVKYS